MHIGKKVASGFGVVAVVTAASCGSGEAPSSATRSEVASPAARRVLDRLRAIRIERPERPPHTPHAPAAMTVILAPSAVLGIDRDRGRFLPRTPAPLARSTAKRAEMSLPRVASGAFRLRDVASGVAIDVEMEGTRDVPGEIADGYVVYRGAHSSGGHVVHRVHAEGTEDYVVFDTAPTESQLRYQVALSEEVAGLRLVSNVLEFLDAGGAPRLRVAPPWGVDSGGKRVEARLSVSGCAVDESPGLPWGRPVTAPGSSACRVAVTWDVDAGVTVMDPAWTTTGSMATARISHTASVLADGRVIVAGGASDLTVLASAEVFNPAGGGSWASAGAMATARGGHTASVLADGRVLVVGGADATGALASVETFNPAGGGAWASAGSMAAPRHLHTASVLTDGRVLVAGGDDTTFPLASAELFNPAGGGVWASAGAMGTPRAYHTASVLTDGRVLVVGGNNKSGNPITLSSAETFDSAGGGAWVSAGSMVVARSSHTASVLADGRVLVVGGGDASAETFSPAGGGSWASAGSMATPRSYHTASVLVDGRVLVAGGIDATAALAAVELFTPAGAGSWASAGPMAKARNEHTASVLADGRLLVAGGADASALASAELWSIQSAGGSCGATGDCAPGLACVDGVCCDSICNGFCQACSAAKKGNGPDGVCGFIGAGLDPDDDCKALGSGTCQSPGLCDGKGACQSKAGTSCGAPSCVDGTTQADPSQCDASGTCVASTTTSSCIPYVCVGLGCKTSCVTSSDCVTNAGFSCNAGKCSKAGDVGASCSTPTDCISGFCADKVCCDTQCAGACKACSAAAKGYGKDGACADVKLGTDPDDDCPTDAPGSCKNTGQCDGSGGCERYGSNTVCGKPSCAGGVLTGTTCDGNGMCGPQTGNESCGLYACADTLSCATSCVVDTDCALKSHCKAGKCTSGLPNGSMCAAPAMCASGFCADAVCCDSPCTGQCEACDATPGVCSAVKGMPHGARKPCDTTDPTCHGECNGGDTTACTYPGTNTTCGASCDAADLKPLQCNGAGKCIAGAATGCAPYACDAASKACKGSCNAVGDCATSAVCDLPSHQCIPSGNECADAFDVKTPTGKEYCKGYKCNAGACQQTCASAQDCDAGSGYQCVNNACTKSGGTGGSGGASGGSAGTAGSSGAAAGGGGAGAAAGPAPDSAGGCGCRVPGSGRPGPGGIFALLAFAVARRRRRASLRLHCARVSSCPDLA